MTGFGISDKGPCRSENQDRFALALEGPASLAVLCDGMGGAAAGALAAQKAVDGFLLHAEKCLREPELLPGETVLRESAEYANICVCDHARRNPDCAGMGCTLVAVHARGETVTVANVGDSRCYLYSAGTLRQITRDHSLVEELIASGQLRREEAANHPRRNIITRALGQSYTLRCDTFTLTAKEGDRLLLCSDGVSNALGDAAISAILAREADCEGACRGLIALSLSRNAADNVTAVVLQP